MIRLTTHELAEIEAKADIYPHIGVTEHISRLREAYAEIDRLNRVIVEWERDMRGDAGLAGRRAAEGRGVVGSREDTQSNLRGGFGRDVQQALCRPG